MRYAGGPNARRVLPFVMAWAVKGGIRVPLGLTMSMPTEESVSVSLEKIRRRSVSVKVRPSADKDEAEKLAALLKTKLWIEALATGTDRATLTVRPSAETLAVETLKGVKSARKRAERICAI